MKLPRKEVSVSNDDYTVNLITKSDRGHSLASVAGDDTMGFAMPQMSTQSLWDIQDKLSRGDIYQDMSEAFSYCGEVVFPQSLAAFRAAIWARGFHITHPHPDVEQAYQRFSQQWNLSALTVEAMQHLSISNNACLIWRVRTTGTLEYVKVYRPDQTRIDPIRSALWCKPSDSFISLVRGATDRELKDYVNKFGENSSIKDWVEAAKPTNVKQSPFPGFVKLVDKGTRLDRDHWVIFTGDGGNTDTAYSPVNMRSIFLDVELVRLLYQGDWATAWMIKNMIVLIQTGESITSGPLAGSRRNYAQKKDLEALKTTFQKSGKAQIVYGNHTIKISFNSPDSKMFSPEKFQAVIDRICFFYGIGQYMILGGGEGATFATASWNVQAIRTLAKRMRELYVSYFDKFLTHTTITDTVFRGMSDVKDYCFKSVVGNVLKLRKHFHDLTLDNVGYVEYSTDGFITVQTYQIVSVSADNGTITTARNLPENANSENTRLVVPINLVLALYGHPAIRFDERIIKDDKAMLSELQMLLNQGPISYQQLLEELGFEFDRMVSQRKIEWDMWKDIVPYFEPRQGITAAIVAKLQDLLIDPDNLQSGNEGGRPEGTTVKEEPVEEDNLPRQ